MAQTLIFLGGGVEITALRGSPQVTYGGIKMGRAGTGIYRI